MKLLNAFSVQMLPSRNCTVTFTEADIWEDSFTGLFAVNCVEIASQYMELVNLDLGSDKSTRKTLSESSLK